MHHPEDIDSLSIITKNYELYLFRTKYLTDELINCVN